MKRILGVLSLALAILCIFACTDNVAQPEKPFSEQFDVFVSGSDGYDTYRNPAVVVTRKGYLLAFCEGRKQGGSDIDIVLKQSHDKGKTWLPMQVVADDGKNTCCSPCVVIDSEVGNTWLLFVKNPGKNSTVWAMKSETCGKTWEEPVEITKSVKDPNWESYITGPGVGVQMVGSNRLIIPCAHTVGGSETMWSHSIHSDDHGENWELGADTGPDTGECQIVQLIDGILVLNMHSYLGNNLRGVATSRDGGTTWWYDDSYNPVGPRYRTGEISKGEVTYDSLLVDPGCQASILRLTDRRLQDKNRILFSNPASTKSEKITVRLSYDECSSWPVSKIIYSGPSGASCLAKLKDGSIGCLYENGVKSDMEKISLARFNLEWLTDGKDSLL